MTDIVRSKSPQSENPRSNEQGGKIVDLNTLRALQKAAKQLNPRNHQTKEPAISITDNAVSSPQKKPINLQESNVVSMERTSTSDLKSKRTKTPEEDYVYNVRNKFQQALSKLYASETKDLVNSYL